MKKTITALLLFATLFTNAQDDNTVYKNSFYWGIGPSLPTGPFRELLPTRVALKLANQFYFVEEGFANGLVNIGLDVSYANIDFNLGIKEENTGTFTYSGTLGPVITVSPVENLGIDAYYKGGYGIFASSGTVNTGYTGNVGANLRYKKLMLGLGFNTLYTGGGSWGGFQLLFGTRRTF